MPPPTIRHIIFDLSEVLIFGLSGFKGDYARELGLTPENEFERFGGPHLHEYLCGASTEEQYLAALMKKNGWDAAQQSRICKLIRENFRQKFPGTIEIAMELAQKYELSLLSDHSREWAAYIQEIHPFIRQIFQHIYFSYAYGKTKREAALFQIVLHDLHAYPAECLFIDDSARNTGVASALGFQVIQFKDAARLRQELLALKIL